MQFDFSTSSRILFGSGKLSEIEKIAPQFGKKALVVTGQGGADPARLLDYLTRSGLGYVLFSVAQEPTVAVVQQAVQLVRETSCDFVIGFGGGSVLDTGKAVSALLTNPGELLDYLEVIGQGRQIRHSAAGYIAIPTTAGTGSEVTRNAVLSVPEQQVKVSLRSPYLLPSLALVDPELTLSLPPAVTASTGMDALTQVLEPFVSRAANAMTDLYCRQGLEYVSQSLLPAYQDGSSLSAREKMSFASLMGGLALANAGLGAVHGFAAPLGGMFHAPHGAICAALLPAVVQVNVTALKAREPDNPLLQRFIQAAKILVRDDRAEILDGIHWLEQIKTELKIPPLAAYGISPADFAQVVEKAAKASSMKGNPIILTHEELRTILEMSV